MAIARYKDLCIDTTLDERLGRFWAAVLGLEFQSDDEAGALKGDVPEQRVWMNVVPEPKTAKHRVHLDVHTPSIDHLVSLGATVLEPAAEFGRNWTVFSDPEGGEFCGFVRAPEDLPAYRLYELGIDCVEPGAIASWWADVFGATFNEAEDKSFCWLSDVPGLPYDSWDFAPVPEPKTVKNRVHWDITVTSLDELEDAGATVLRERDEEIGWTVCADPEGNEFCAFTGS